MSDPSTCVDYTKTAEWIADELDRKLDPNDALGVALAALIIVAERQGIHVTALTRALELTKKLIDSNRSHGQPVS